MLKTPDPPMVPPDPSAEPGVGGLVQRLLDDGKAYARSELNLAKAIATAKVGALKVPAILFAAAFLFLQVAVTLIGITIYFSLLPLIGPVFGGIIAILVTLGIAGGLGWLGVRKVREIL